MANIEYKILAIARDQARRPAMFLLENIATKERVHILMPHEMAIGKNVGDIFVVGVRITDCNSDPEPPVSKFEMDSV